MNITCTKCGRNIPFGLFYCPDCGATLMDMQDSAGNPYSDYFWFCPGKTGKRENVPDGGLPIIPLGVGDGISPHPVVWQPYIFFNMGGGNLGVQYIDAPGSAWAIPTGFTGDIIPVILPPYLILFDIGGAVGYFHLLNESQNIDSFMRGKGAAIQINVLAGAPSLDAGTLPAVHIGHEESFAVWISGGNIVVLDPSLTFTVIPPADGFPPPQTSPCIDEKGEIWTTGAGTIHHILRDGGSFIDIPIHLDNWDGTVPLAPVANPGGGCRCQGAIPAGARNITVDAAGNLTQTVLAGVPSAMPGSTINRAIVRDLFGNLVVIL